MTLSPNSTQYRPKIIETAFVDFISERIYPFGSPVTAKVKLLNKVWLTNSLVAIELAPNKRWQRQLKRRQSLSALSPSALWQAGQHIHLGVKIGSICHQRNYSLLGTTSASPLSGIFPARLNSQQLGTLRQAKVNDVDAHRHADTANSLHIVIKPQGLVSNYLAYDAKVGEVFDCDLPEGEFTLAQQRVTAQQPLGFIASGSGITPMPGLISEALRTGAASRPVTLLYYYNNQSHQTQADTDARFAHKNSHQQYHDQPSHATQLRHPAHSPRYSDSAIHPHGAVFIEYWQQLAKSYPNFRYHLVNTANPSSYIAASRHLTLPVLETINLADAQCLIFACGAPGLMLSLPQLVPGKLAMEYFEQPPNLAGAAEANNQSEPNPSAVPADSPKAVRFRRRQRQLQMLTATQSILSSAEAEGIKLQHGCRQGICNMCRCDKVSGVVENLKTGELSHDGFESIKPCISTPLTDVVLDL